MRCCFDKALKGLQVSLLHVEPTEGFKFILLRVAHTLLAVLFERRATFALKGSFLLYSYEMGPEPSPERLQ